MIYLDNAATTSPKPQTVVDAMNFATENYSSNPGRSGHDLSIRCGEMIYKTRQIVADFFGAKAPDNIVFTPNCTTSLNILIKGLFSRKDHIIISPFEHNAVYRPCLNSHLLFDVARFSSDEDEFIYNFERLIRRNTKAIITTHASNVFGIKMPIRRLGELCRKYGLIFIVDAAQTAGLIDINCKRDNIDYLCIAPHKGLYAPMGTGILITDNRPIPLIYGGTGVLSKETTQPNDTPERYESGTVNVPGIYGIQKGIAFVNNRIFNIYTHEMNLIIKLYDLLKSNTRYILYTDRPNYTDFLPVLSFNIKDINCDEVGTALSRQGFAVRAGFHCAPLAHKTMETIDCGTVRVSPSIFNNEQDITDFFDALNKIK